MKKLGLPSLTTIFLCSIAPIFSNQITLYLAILSTLFLYTYANNIFCWLQLFSLALDDAALRQNPLSKQLLESLTSATVGDIASLPTYALRAQLNFHRTEYLHNLHVAQVYSQRARHSEQISESAYATLASRMETEEGPDDEILNHMKSSTSSSGSFSTSGSAPIPIAFDLAAHSEEVVTVPGYTSSAPATLWSSFHSFYTL